MQAQPVLDRSSRTTCEQAVTEASTGSQRAGGAEPVAQRVAQRAAGPLAEPLRHAVHLPPLRSLLRHGGLRVAEATLIPLGLFYLLYHFAGLRGALIAALAWSYAVIIVRLLRGRPVPALLLIATAMLTLRSGISLATNNAFLYFLQPTLGNFAVAAMFLLSVRLGRPLARRLADDVCPLPAHVMDRKPIIKIFSRITILWALVNIANGSTSLWALLSSSLGGVLLARTVGSFTIVTIAVYLSYVWFRRCLHSEGYTLRWGAPA
jgi:intracellular septation protein A